MQAGIAVGNAPSRAQGRDFVLTVQRAEPAKPAELGIPAP
jgi:hypothetical protein